MHSEGYRSGHNEAVLKTVCLYGHVGSNPTPSAKTKSTPLGVLFVLFSSLLSLHSSLFTYVCNSYR